MTDTAIHQDSSKVDGGFSPDRLLRLRQVMERVGPSKATVYSKSRMVAHPANCI
jgi:predicted DNA-binding transcriptional regulator AlpA